MTRSILGSALLMLSVGCGRPADQPASPSSPSAPVPPDKSTKEKGGNEKPKPKIDTAAQDRAVEFVKQRGGRVERDDAQPGNPVVGVNFATLGATVTDDDLKELAPLKNLTELYLSPKVIGEGVTGVGLKHLAGLEHLTHLGLSKTKLTDAGLKELAKLKNLTHLYLDGGSVGSSGAQDSWLNELEPLSNLTFLDLEYAKVTDEGLKALASVPKLQSINLDRCSKITDAGFKELARVKNLAVQRGCFVNLFM